MHLNFVELIIVMGALLGGLMYYEHLNDTRIMGLAPSTWIVGSLVLWQLWFFEVIFW
jgi:hypothetical protein|tara:strand:- start:359 stop:529 length:171 start_codon:yes stop_codon:yes gene_type:complete